MHIDQISFALGLVIGCAMVGLIWFLADYVKKHARN